MFADAVFRDDPLAVTENGHRALCRIIAHLEDHREISLVRKGINDAGARELVKILRDPVKSVHLLGIDVTGNQIGGDVMDELIHAVLACASGTVL